jgi:predicted Fe-Mo cluster-binding NifX family protein
MSIKRIAAVTDDGLILSNHFGMALQYLVSETEDDRILRQEARAKPHHSVHPDHGQPQSHNEQLHEDMFTPIRDCQVLLVGGMGGGAYKKAQSVGLEVVLTGGTIADALQAYLNGQLISSDLRLQKY